MHFRVSVLVFALLAGCGEKSYEECIKDAVSEGKTDYGIKLLQGLCETAEEKRQVAQDQRCFASLERRYGAENTNAYKDSLRVNGGRCDLAVNLSETGNSEAGAQAAFDAAALAAAIDAASAATDAASASTDAAQPVSEAALAQ